MSDEREIERIMQLAFCSEEDARAAFSKTHDVVDAVDLLLVVPKKKDYPKIEKISEDKQFFNQIRKNMENLDNNITNLNQSDSSSQVSMHIPTLQEEPFQRHCYTQNNHLTLREVEEQKPETAYR